MKETVSSAEASTHPVLKCILDSFSMCPRLLLMGGDAILLFPDKDNLYTKKGYSFGDLYVMYFLSRDLNRDRHIVFSDFCRIFIKQGVDICAVMKAPPGHDPPFFKMLSGFENDGLIRVVKRNVDRSKFSGYDVISKGAVYDTTRISILRPYGSEQPLRLDIP